ncbi:MAG: HEAT repeat domain-containing protein [Verrucomicrobiota bacterium]
MTWAGLCLAICLTRVSAPAAAERLIEHRQLSSDRLPEALLAFRQSMAKAPGNGQEATNRAALAAELATWLAPETSDEAKEFAFRHLALIGTENQAPVLAEWLLDPERSDLARFALAAIPHPQATASLLKALERSQGAIKIGLINSLGNRGANEAIDVLGKLLSDTEFQEPAAAALGRIGGEDACRWLRQALHSSSGDTTDRLADGYLACAEDFIAQGQSERAVAIYRELLVKRFDIRVRTAAMRGLVACSPEGIRVTLSALQSDEPLLVRAARGCIQSMPGAEATRRFAAELVFLPKAAQIMLVTALAARGDGAALPAVRNAVNSRDPELRVSALEALGVLGDRSVVEPLVQAASEATGISTVALSSLRSLRGDGVDQAIVRQLNQVEPSLAARLIAVLASRHAIAVVESLLPLANVADPQVACEASAALGQMAEPFHLVELLKMLSDPPNELTRDCLEQAIGSIASRSGDVASLSNLIVGLLEKEGSQGVRGSFIRVLGRIGDGTALQAVTAAWAASSEPLRDIALHALAEWPNPGALPSLMEVFEQTQDPTCRGLVLKAVVRLTDPTANPPTLPDNLQVYERLMSRLRDPGEWRLAVSGLSSLNDSGAINVIAPLLDLEPIKEEAASALVKLAVSIASSDPASAAHACELALKVVANPITEKRAAELLGELQRSRDYIFTWQLAGPYSQPGKSGQELFDVVFPPELPEDSRTHWRLVNGTFKPGEPVVLNLAEIVGGIERVVYLRTAVYSDRPRPVRLRLRTDDGVKAWVNGRVVHTRNVVRSLTSGEDEVPVTLRTGWNALLLKVTQAEGEWGACAQLRTVDRPEPDGLRFDAERAAGLPTE